MKYEVEYQGQCEDGDYETRTRRFETKEEAEAFAAIVYGRVFEID